MYFPFLELHGWGKRFAVRPQTVYSEVPKGTSDSIGKSRRQKILAQAKVPKTREYCMYFPFLELHGWGKRFAVRPQTVYSEVPLLLVGISAIGRHIRLAIAQRVAPSPIQSAKPSLPISKNRSRTAMLIPNTATPRALPGR